VDDKRFAGQTYLRRRKTSSTRQRAQLRQPSSDASPPLSRAQRDATDAPLDTPSSTGLSLVAECVNNERSGRHKSNAAHVYATMLVA